MDILIFVSIAIALYAIWVAQNAHSRIDNPPRSFHFTLSEARKTDYSKGESEFDKARIKFYVLYLSGKRVFFDEHTFNNININSKIDTSAKIDSKKELVLHSWGGALRFGYVADQNKEAAEQGEELHTDVLSLPQTPENRKRLEEYLKQEGWKIEKGLSLDDVRMTKDKLEIYITYIS